MIIGLLTVSIYLPFSHSLKEKRSEVGSLKRRLQNKFNISVIESAHQDLSQTMTLSVAALAGNTSLAHSTLDKVLGFIGQNTQGEIIEVQRELF